MYIWVKVKSLNFPIMDECYVKIGNVFAKAHVHSACIKKGVFFNIICPVTGKKTAKKVQADYYATTEDFEKLVHGG